MSKDDLIREYHERRGTWQALLGVYAVLVSSLILSATAVL